LFIGCVSGGSGGLKNTRITEGTQRFILIRAIGALHLAVDDPYTQEHPTFEGLQQSIRERFGRGSLGADPRNLAAGEAFPLVGEEENGGSGGGALGAPL
jgi:hypothetical protein